MSTLAEQILELRSDGWVDSSYHDGFVDGLRAAAAFVAESGEARPDRVAAARAIYGLEPCPFCGSDAGFGVEMEGGYFVQCANDACGASSALIFPLMDDVKPLLIERWNKRASGDLRRHIICVCPDCVSRPDPRRATE